MSSNYETMMETIPIMMKKIVEDKYFNITCDGDKCNKTTFSPCFTCGRQYKYYFNEIDKIDDIEVSIILKIQPRDKQDRRLQCIFVIQCDTIVCEDYDKTIISYDDNKFTLELEDWVVIFRRVKHIIDNIHFDKFQSYFTMEPINDYKIIITSFLCENNTRLTKRYDSCCICWENTKRRTICCRGYICAQCYVGVKPRLCSHCSHNVINEDCEIFGCNERPCPLCRKSMYSAIIYDDSDFT
jgi:hypothetical protein